MVDAEFMESLRQLSFGVETTWGTAATTKNLWPGGIPQRFSGKVSATNVPYSGFGTAQKRLGLATTARDVAWSFESLLQNPKFCQYLAAAADTGAGPYTHTIDMDQTGATNPAGLTLVETSVDPASGGSNHVTRQYTGAKLASARFSYPNKDIIKAEFTGTSKVPTADTAAQTVTAATTAPYLSANTVLTVGGDTFTQAFNATVEITTGLVSDNHGFNTLDIHEQARGEAGATITFDRYFKNVDVFADIIAGTEVDISLVTTRGANDTFTINLNDCQYTEHDKSEGYTDKQKETATLNVETWQIVVVDSTASW